MKTFYIEKMDKHKFTMKKIKIEGDNFKINVSLEIEKNIKKIVNKLIKNEVTNVVLSKELYQNMSLMNAINSSNIKIFDGRWLEKYLTIEILNYIINKKDIKRQEIEIAITTNEITDLVIELIRILSKQYKRLTIVTNHISKLRKIEKEIYDTDGILIVISNNQKKSLAKAQIILNMDFNKEVFNNYQIYEEAIIINLEGNMKIESKRFNGININDYEIETGREEIIWRENVKKFRTKDLVESVLYMKDTFNNIRKKIIKNNISIKELYGINGPIKI